MDYFFTLDWSNAFVPQLTLPEVLVRGTVIYVALLVLLRILPKWQVGPGSVASLLFVVLLGGLAANGVTGEAESVTDFLLLIATVAMWVVVVDWLSYRFPSIHFLSQDSPACLIRDGRILSKNLRRELISEEDLKTQLRQHEVDDISQVREAYLEADGNISIVKKEDANGTTTAGTTTPEDDGEPSPANRSSTLHQKNGCRAEEMGSPSRNFDGEPSEADHDDDPELQAFLAAAERLQDRLEWHQEQAAKFKEALTRHGVRIKPLTTNPRDKTIPKKT